MLTVNEEAFIDALKLMYFLKKQEIAHTINLKELKGLCELLGNELRASRGCTRPKISILYLK